MTSDKTECNRVKKAIDVAISALNDQHWNKFILKCGRSPLSSKPFWNKINEFRSNTTNKSIPTLTHEGAHFETDSDKASLFSSVLGKVFSDEVNPANNFDDEFKKRVENENSKEDYSNVNRNFKEISLKEVIKSIRKLPLGSSPGPDKISNEMLKNLPVNMVKSITVLANKTLKECSLPREDCPNDYDPQERR